MNTRQTASEPLPASDLFAPWWAVNVPESENDHTCTRCGHSVHLEHGSEWLGPNDNYHWNLCNSCAHELLIEIWMKLQNAMADTKRMDRLESDLLTITNQAVTASVDMSGKPWRAQFHGERKATRFLTIRAAADSAMRANVQVSQKGWLEKAMKTEQAQTPAELAAPDCSPFPWEPIPEWMFGKSVEARNALQNCGRVHPYTCGNNDCRKATNQAPLRAVEDGWVCDHCGYTQPLTANSDYPHQVST